jgi:hypothetical protein
MASASVRRLTWSGIAATCAAGALALSGCHLSESSRTTTIGSVAEAAPPSLSAEEFGSTPSPAPAVAAQETPPAGAVATDIPAPPFPVGKTSSPAETNVAKQPVAEMPAANEFSVAPVLTEAAPATAPQAPTIQTVQHLESGDAPVAVIGEPPALPPSHSADHGPPIMTPWGEVCPHCQPVTAAIWKRKA